MSYFLDKKPEWSHDLMGHASQNLSVDIKECGLGPQTSFALPLPLTPSLGPDQDRAMGSKATDRGGDG